MNTLRNILELIRFSHTIFALPFALLAAAMAWSISVPDGHAIGFHWVHLVAILICMVAARSAAMAFNRLIDRGIDAENPRTAGRHLPAGKLSVQSVVWFTVLSSLVFVVANALFLPNWLPLALSIPVLAVLLGYSYAKRFTSLAHYWLGVALMLSPICVWIALRGLIVIDYPADLLPSIVLGGAVLFWVGGFDVIYACQDYEYDRDKGLNSIPVRLGVGGALRAAAASHAVTVLLLMILPTVAGADAGLGWLFYLTVAGVAGLLIYEHSIVRANDLTRVNVAFFNVNCIISVALLVAGCVDLWWV